MLAIKQ